jgi:hypothetical protein
MDQEEKQQQLMIAKAMLRRATRSFEDKTGTKEQVEEAQKRYDEIMQFDVPKYQKQVEKQVRAVERAAQAGRGAWLSSSEQVEEMPLEVREIIDKLLQERDEIHAKKAIICNSLHKIPKDQNAATEVRQILAFRNQWKALNAKVRFVQQHGQLPPEDEADPDLSQNKMLDESGFQKAQEVKELWALREEIDNKRTVLSKARKKLTTVKEVAKIAHYKQKVAMLEWELSIMGSVFNARK